ncbi:MAG: YidC/Oxa1 family membrane protein insertase, partial [Clostridia bacterium]|nr:YidC/Oxa1 family membrane protein insertase [Clostridia bacterium]
TTYAYSAMTTSQTSQSSSGNDQTANTMKSMQTFMPFMTAFFAFTLPAALGFYWTISNLVRMVQQFFMNKKMKKEIQAEKEAKANEPTKTVHPSQKKKRRK